MKEKKKNYLQERFHLGVTHHRINIRNLNIQ